MDGDSIRVLIFAGSIILLSCAELLFPRRRPGKGRWKRWPGNFGVVAAGALLSRLTFPVLPFGLALFMNDNGWGLFPLLGVSGPVSFVLAVLIFDLAIYSQHRAFHYFTPLWMLHRMHHVDTFYDFSTGVRFHPVELALSILWKLLLVAVLGPPAAAVLAFEVILNTLAMFNHANMRLPLVLDRYLRLIVVTPDMHRVHHSIYMDENNQNFGFNFPWWDRIFKTYTAQPRDGHETMQIGLRIFRSVEHRSFIKLLLIPFVRSK